jgi:hypothetical protein
MTKANHPAVTLRALTPDDAPAIEEMIRVEPPKRGLIAIRSAMAQDRAGLEKALARDTFGVVAEAAGTPGIVGMGMARLGECQYEGALRPYALLHNLHVRASHRRMGVASGMAAWRLERIRAQCGPEAVILGSILETNFASLAASRWWCTQQVDRRAEARTALARRWGPRPLAGIEVRPADLRRDLEQFAERQNACFGNDNLYPPAQVESLARAAQEDGAGQAGLPGLWVAARRGGDLLAGLQLAAGGRYSRLEVIRMAWPVRAANAVLGLIPPDGVVRRARAFGFWFAPGQAEAARYLWDSLRWLWRGRARLFTVNLDPFSPLAGVVRAAPYLKPVRHSLQMTAPAPMRLEPFLYVQHL